MVRIFRDDDVDARVRPREAVDLMGAGYGADARGEVVPFPKSRSAADGVSLSWTGAALPGLDVLGYRAYLYNADGADRGDQVVALYRFSTMELKALFLGRRVGILRTGAAVVAALRIADPELPSLGLLGTGTQARQIARCAAAVLPLGSLWAWSPNPTHREEFRAWASEELSVPVHLADTAAGVLREARAIAIATTSEQPVVTAPMLPAPRLLVSLSAYRRPEIAPPLLEASARIWTDSVVQATAPGTLLAEAGLRGKTCALAEPAALVALRDQATTRIVVTTGAAWEEVVLAESLWQGASSTDHVLNLDLERRRIGPGPG
jgi:ornithine cyclodeaminase/alanine dehydrogenase-like protein (mu-crystallin family)